MWALTSGLCSEQHAYGWLAQQIAAIEAGPDAQAVRGRRALLDVLHQLPAALADYYAEVAGSVPEWPQG